MNQFDKRQNSLFSKFIFEVVGDAIKLIRTVVDPDPSIPQHASNPYASCEIRAAGCGNKITWSDCPPVPEMKKKELFETMPGLKEYVQNCMKSIKEVNMEQIIAKINYL
eukprot:TRINITY_DN23797_c3_g1_i1.p2 TRINITY_DN23797_c3_g1~~TRINITY_DN23797_c3_g1_i1.p2  ORF type:complete len:109 (-),score=10.30 TRINITY_DN23797_c3_g1_i1:212-538(-)